MSGGFFRGTSAEQDTRFSNKQAKLMKSQKFAPELDHLVDIAKVKMDVLKPWIAKRVTELLGFEDEVLINFINGLLEGKDINGKQIQIQLTGFMEKHTGKFMKDLWSLLLSAQNNASGVPQQFLDAKEEETRKKKEELDRIGNEMQKIKEKGSRVSEQVHAKMDGGVIDNSTTDPNSKYALKKDSKVYSDDEEEPGKRNGFRGKTRASRSPQSADQHPSPHRERNRSRKLSKSPRTRWHSISSERRYRSPQRSVSPILQRSCDESLSPRGRYPPKMRSTSRSRNRSLSPARCRVRSPVHRRLASPDGRRSLSPLQRRSRSPRRHRSPSPWRRRSPSSPRWRRRSPSQWRRRRRSPSPWRRRSPSPRPRRSPSPRRRRSPSPRRRRSPSPRRRRSPSPRRPVRRHRKRSLSSSLSPVRRKPSSPSRHRSPPLKQRSSSPSRARSLSPNSGSPSPVKRRVPAAAHLRSPNQLDRSSSLHSQVSSSPVRRNSEVDLPTLKPRSRDQRSPRYQHTQKGNNVIPDVALKGGGTARRMTSKSPHSKDRTSSEDRDDKAYKGKSSQRSVGSPRHGKMDTPEKSSGEHYHYDISSSKKRKDIRRENKLAREAIGLRNSTDDVSSSFEKPAVLSPSDGLKEGVEESLKLMKKDDLHSPTLDSSESEGSDRRIVIGTKKRTHRKLSHREIGCKESSGGDSGVEDRKEVKRRRKEEKKLRKEERRRRREERRSRKEEKRVHKRRSKDSDSIVSSDSDKHENGIKQATEESDKKRLENELREKALQNIRAKKGMSR